MAGHALGPVLGPTRRVMNLNCSVTSAYLLVSSPIIEIHILSTCCFPNKDVAPSSG